MFRIKVNPRIEQIFAFFYRFGFWNHQEKETIRESMLKWFYTVYFSSLPMSLLAGAVVNENKDSKIFLIEVALISIVLWVKLLHIIWRKKEILKLVNEMCDYRIDDHDSFIVVNHKSNMLMTFATVFFSVSILGGSVSTLVVPLAGTERKLFYQVAFPLDWKNDEYAFWMAFMYVFTEVGIGLVGILYSVIMWCLMAHLGWRYDILGRQIKKCGESEVDEQADEPRISDSEKDTLYSRDLVEAMTSHSHLKELTEQLDMFMSRVFVIQLITSGLSVCGSIYSISFMRGDTYLDFICYILSLLFNIFDIFMIMFFGNEIKLASGRLSHRLYESNWIDRSQSIKKDMLIFGEFLLQPQQLVILKMYPLALETFSRILNSAYSMFNILKNLKQ